MSVITKVELFVVFWFSFWAQAGLCLSYPSVAKDTSIRAKGGSPFSLHGVEDHIEVVC